MTTTKLAPLFSSQSDEWATPQDLYDTLDAEFHFTLDAAATFENCKTPHYLGPDNLIEGYTDALAHHWGYNRVVWLNPPYSQVRQFVAKAAEEAQAGRATIVCLLPARTDTRYFHEHIWDQQWHRTRPGVELRFLKGRLKFGGAINGAPFPSVIVVFRRWPQ